MTLNKEMLKGLVAEGKKIAIGGHVRPDGDCVGSTMGLFQYLLERVSGERSGRIWKRFRRVSVSFRQHRGSGMR